mmetsp:Transcript_23170/g.58044  ORF Transcript_23170/g.58044 Transcript_23170/m.58044 type:complete len:206 (-) Transcript_23170:131-748(-)
MPLWSRKICLRDTFFITSSLMGLAPRSPTLLPPMWSLLIFLFFISASAIAVAPAGPIWLPMSSTLAIFGSGFMGSGFRTNASAHAPLSPIWFLLRMMQVRFLVVRMALQRALHPTADTPFHARSSFLRPRHSRIAAASSATPSSPSLLPRSSTSLSPLSLALSLSSDVATSCASLLCLCAAPATLASSLGSNSSSLPPPHSLRPS